MHGRVCSIHARRATQSGDGFRTAASPVNFLPRGDEELLGGAIILIDGDHAGLEDGKGGDVVGQNTEGSGEGRNVNLRSGVG